MIYLCIRETLMSHMLHHFSVTPKLPKWPLAQFAVFKELLFLNSNFLVKISNLPSEKQLKYMYILENIIESSGEVDLKMLKVFLLN